MLDKQKIVDALRYESCAKIYQGDLIRDAADCLEGMVDREIFVEDFKVNTVGEIMAQLPREDFLGDIIDQLRDLTSKGLKKSEIIDKIGSLIESAEDLQQTQANASGYAFSVLKNLK